MFGEACSSLDNPDMTIRTKVRLQEIRLGFRGHQLNTGEGFAISQRKFLLELERRRDWS